MPVAFLVVKHKTSWSKWCCGEVTLRGIALCAVFARCVVLKWPFKASPTSVANTFNFPYGNFSHTINGAQRSPYKEGTTWDAWRTKCIPHIWMSNWTLCSGVETKVSNKDLPFLYCCLHWFRCLTVILVENTKQWFSAVDCSGGTWVDIS